MDSTKGELQHPLRQNRDVFKRAALFSSQRCRCRSVVVIVIARNHGYDFLAAGRASLVAGSRMIASGQRTLLQRQGRFFDECGFQVPLGTVGLSRLGGRILPGAILKTAFGFQPVLHFMAAFAAALLVQGISEGGYFFTRGSVTIGGSCFHFRKRRPIPASSTPNWIV